MQVRAEQSQRDGALVALRDLIATGEYGPGDRLPPERELIGNLGVTRSTLRRALDTLEREGAIWRHVGKGTFVAHDHDGVTGGLDAIARQITPVRMMRARLSIEPAIAREAAINASAEAINRLRATMQASVAATTWQAYEHQDDLFHQAIARATDNILLQALFDQLNAVRRKVALGTVVRQTERPPRDHSSFAEHQRITDAIAARDPAAAHEAMRGHLGSVSARLFGEV